MKYEPYLEIQELGKDLVNKAVEYLRGEVSREEIMESFNKAIQNEINEFCHHNLRFSTWDDIDDEFDYSEYFDDMNDVFKLLNKNKH